MLELVYTNPTALAVHEIECIKQFEGIPPCVVSIDMGLTKTQFTPNKTSLAQLLSILVGTATDCEKVLDEMTATSNNGRTNNIL